MPIKRPQLITGKYYHIVKRGVEKREIFLDDEDHQRFINSLLVFNDKKPAPWSNRAFWGQREQFSWLDYTPENPLVEIHAFVLIKNHFHLLVNQLVDNGITDLMRKLGGYSYYFNKKYGRVGPLFQGRFRAVLIKNDEQLKHIFVYIHTNPLEMIEFNWKEEGIKNPQKAIQFLEKYQWSSYADYLGMKNFPNVIYDDFFFNLLEDKEGCRKEVESWVLYKADFNKMKNIILE